MGTVLPVHELAVNQTHIRFVDQGARLQGVTGPLSCHISTRQSAQLLIDQRDELFQRSLISLSPGQKQLR